MKILLIDDDDVCRSPAAELLRRNDWQVIEAADGATGIALAIEHQPEVILCDLLMPRGNGFDVCRAVRAHPGMRDTKIIVCTGRDFPADHQAARDAGADIYLIKPVAFARLQEALAAVVPPRNGTVVAPVKNAPSSTRIKFWGVRGSIPTPGPSTVFFGGNTACVEVRAQGEIIVLDAGSGIRPLGLSLAAEFKEQPIAVTVLITHTHWDHIQGFPFFLPAYDSKNKVHIVGYEGACAGLRATLAGQMESPYFPIALNQMPGNILIDELKDCDFSVGTVAAQTCFTNHPGVCVGFRLQTEAGAVVYMPDNETFSRSAARTATGLPCATESNVKDFVRNADVLIADTQYDALEYESHVGWGHGCVDEVVHLALAANVKRLFLFHHDPSHDDRFISNMLVHARRIASEAGSSLVIDAAREGEEIVLVAQPAG